MPIRHATIRAGRRYPRPAVVGAALGVLAIAIAVRVTLVSYATPTALVLGATTVIAEESSGLAYEARVDTGAAVSSVHVGPDDMQIVDASPEPTENVSKTVRLRLDNGLGEHAWVETRIEDYVEVRSANGAEHRYRVRLPLRCGDVVKESVVNLKDRSNMTYKFLLGRDFIQDDFLVDVSHTGTEPLGVDDLQAGG